MTVLILLMSSVAFAGEIKDIPLPPPRVSGGMPLMEALQRRRSSREFDPKPLPPQVLSDLLWAAWGYNRPAEKKRTAPSASNKQEIEVYVAMPEGIFLYDAAANSLRARSAKDLRALTGEQDFVGSSPINLVYVADTAKMEPMSARSREYFSAADTGFIAENVYLFCASENLAVVVRGSIDKTALSKAMGLKLSQHVTLAQSIGYPKDP